ncbi:hypothetical protein EV188_10318 [Actinomycetospora succinea]|uniref:Uncharacterized protein n=1 Tax=Actinomycetospora succinea TaxID=663603 RepID=A0A4R6VMF3_9PSEU|nr:hypothetical protein [Actinomycetospora succinea]TDQ60525.1 hypothetical protein EV188_10318 [Actinomycetospora succinea]
MIRHPAPPRVEAPAGLADVAELGEPWAATAWHHAVAIAAGWRGEPTWTPWGYPPPIPYDRIPAPRGPVSVPPAPTRPDTTPRWMPTPPIGIAPA